MFSKTETDLLTCLRVIEWKTTTELIKEIRTLRKNLGQEPLFGIFCSLFSKDLGDLFLNPSFSSIYIGLDKLEAARFIESRWRDERPETLIKRGGYRRREYSLTQQGRRVQPEPRITKISRLGRRPAYA